MMFLVFLLLFTSSLFAQTSKEDTSQVYESEHNLLLEFPQKIWDAGVYPIGKFFIWEEKYAIHTRIYDFFTFHKHQIGIFPFLTIGGETGTAFGGTAFWRNFSGKDNSLNGLFTLANKKNYTGKAAFSNPELLGSKFLLETDFFYQKTENDFNYTSGFFHYKGYEEVSFAEKQLQTDFELAWRNQNHFFTTYLPETRISLVGGYKTFRADLPQN
ncbi:hypothetical protein IT568_01310, partial [bacterium]|nr:hypothetical protein [bacterium]